eukprot:Sspe_Gene.18982::Locus_6878_Transcript_1_1_Confidence_1.000_Length_654::g.18982::m.18982
MERDAVSVEDSVGVALGFAVTEGTAAVSVAVGTVAAGLGVEVATKVGVCVVRADSDGVRDAPSELREREAVEEGVKEFVCVGGGVREIVAVEDREGVALGDAVGVMVREAESVVDGD